MKILVTIGVVISTICLISCSISAVNYYKLYKGLHRDYDSKLSYHKSSNHIAKNYRVRLLLLFFNIILLIFGIILEVLINV